jgi:hypothetical protein
MVKPCRSWYDRPGLSHRSTAHRLSAGVIPANLGDRVQLTSGMTDMLRDQKQAITSADPPSSIGTYVVLKHGMVSDPCISRGRIWNNGAWSS